MKMPSDCAEAYSSYIFFLPGYIYADKYLLSDVFDNVSELLMNDLHYDADLDKIHLSFPELGSYDAIRSS